ncbi:unnamed protein product, partial [Tetraodon nigroviridis]
RFIPGQGVVLYPQIGDKLDIVCPRVEGPNTEGVEFFKVYLVPREQLESCSISKADTPLLNCVKPDQDVKFTLKFQEFSPNLWGLEFFRGRDYYIISTSNGTLEGIDNQEGGVCRTRSMKMIMKVGQNPSDPSPNDNPTRLPQPPKNTDAGGNEVLEKPGESFTPPQGAQGRQRWRWRRRRGRELAAAGLGGGHLCGHRLRQRHLHRHHRHAGAAAAQVPAAAPQALAAACRHAVAQHAGHAQARQRRRQQQRLGAQRHHYPAQDCRQRLLPPLREGQRRLRTPRLHRARNAAAESRQHLLQGLSCWWTRPHRRGTRPSARAPPRVPATPPPSGLGSGCYGYRRPLGRTDGLKMAALLLRFLDLDGGLRLLQEADGRGGRGFALGAL